MPSLRDITIFLFEAAWTDKFTEDDGFFPQASIFPYIKALSENFRCNVIYRQIRTVDDFKTWTKAIKNSKTGLRVVWLSGHGVSYNNKISIRMPDHHKTRTGNLLQPQDIKKALLKVGAVDGLIIDSCMFGTNTPESWAPNTTKWAMAYEASVNWTESAFFGIKTLEWLYERNTHPSNGQEAKSFFEKCITTGGYRNKEDQFSLEEFANALKVAFHYKTQGSSKWHTRKYPAA